MAIDYDRSVLIAAGDAGLRVWVCLLHNAILVWFADRGRFAAQNALDTWLRWVDFAAFNTPTSYAHKAYLAGMFPPGRRDPDEMVAVLKTVHTCDFEAALRLRETGKPTCSNEALLPLYPADDSPETAHALVWGSWLALAHHPRYVGAFGLHGFAYYYGALVTAQGAGAAAAVPGR